MSVGKGENVVILALSISKTACQEGRNYRLYGKKSCKPFMQLLHRTTTAVKEAIVKLCSLIRWVSVYTLYSHLG